MATTDFDRLADHLDAVDKAYARLRVVLIDPYPGIGEDDPCLTADQRSAVADFQRAEEALQLYRRNAYGRAAYRYDE
jgi:hypothetical protein